MATLFSDLDRTTAYPSSVTPPAQTGKKQQLAAFGNDYDFDTTSTPSAAQQTILNSGSASPQSSSGGSSLIGSPSSSTNMGGCGGSGGSTCSSSGISSISNANSATHLVEDTRALQLALELSMVGLSDSVSAAVIAAAAHHHSQYIDMPNGGGNGMSQSSTLNQFASILPGMEDRSKKSQNMTECVPVPSSEHVAEIVGRQGCKIKALRAKTNTYIKTPVRGEEPVFVVTGRKEDVAKAKREILSAAEHFSLIRASRKPVLAGGLGKAPPGPPSIPGQVTIQVRVPYRVVGLVVGPKGATIKHIQQETHTYIVTPSRDKEPIFEVTGLPDNVQAARKQIEAHIALRTGSISPSVHTINSLSQMLSDEVSPEFLASLYKNGICSGFDYVDQPMQSSTAANNLGLIGGTMGLGNGQFGAVNGTSRSCSSSSSSTSSKSAVNGPELMNIWKNLADSIDGDEGIGESPSIWTLPPVSSALGSRSSPSASVSPTDSLLGGADGSIVGNQMQAANAANYQTRRECLVCGDKKVNAALVPCGHNMFCMECATRVRTTDSLCPVCSQHVVQAIHIKPF